jgi:SAM-dependent methyltransferase
MTLAFRSDETHPRVSALLADLGIAPGTVDLAVDERDEMLGFLVESHGGDRDRALFQYFQSGASIAGSLGQVLRWRFPDPGRRMKLLDFASGYGRVTRFLLREVPPERVWVADVYEGGVRFQEERFGVHGLISAIRPEDFVCAERFDAILVTSLFTHLPEERFVAWLRVLLGLLAPGGLLAFSAHSPEVLPAGVEMPAEGFLFQPISESGSLDKSDYGSTWVTGPFVRSALERAIGQEASLHHVERALCNFQDLYIALPEPGVDFSSLAFQGEPQLFVEKAELTAGGRLEFSGWAAVRNGTVRAVEIWLDGERLGTAPVDDLRPDVAGFFFGDGRQAPSGWICACSLPAGASRSTAVLRLRVIDGGGHGHVLWAGSVEGLLLAASRLEAGQLQGCLRHAETLLAEERARAAVERSALQTRIAAMEASRFWKLRNAWFRLKARLGRIERSG